MTEFIPIDRLLVEQRPPDTPVAFRGGQAVSFASFQARAATYARFFAGRAARDWALHYEDSQEFACALMGAWHAGKCVTLPADVRATTCAQLRAAACALAGNFDNADLAQDAFLPPADYAFSALPLDRVSLTIYTSGSSGKPCAIPKRLGQVTNEILALARQWQALPARAHVLATVSHQHIYGLLFKLLWPLSVGRPFVSERLAFPEQVVQQMARASCVLVSSPAHLKRLPPHLPWQAAASVLAGVFSSGGPLPEFALDSCKHLLGQAPWEVYGSSETGGIAWRQRSDGHSQMHWQLLDDVEADVTSAGQLKIRSPHLPDPASWFLSEDLARRHPDGFELLGRADRIVKLEEKRVSLSQVERELLLTGWFDEVRALILTDGRDRLAIATVPNPDGWQQLERLGRRAFNETLRQRLGNFLPDEARPRHWRHLWAFPCNSQGKLRDDMLSPWFDESAPLFRVKVHDAASASLELEAPPRSPYFAGHFPGHPILPGVAQLEWVSRIAAALFPSYGDFNGLHALKFQQPILPGTLLQLQLKLDLERGRLQFSLASTDGPHASGSIAFKEVSCGPAR